MLFSSLNQATPSAKKKRLKCNNWVLCSSQSLAWKTKITHPNSVAGFHHYTLSIEHFFFFAVVFLIYCVLHSLGGFFPSIVLPKKRKMNHLLESNCAERSKKPIEWMKSHYNCIFAFCLKSRTGAVPHASFLPTWDGKSWARYTFRCVKIWAKKKTTIFAYKNTLL